MAKQKYNAILNGKPINTRNYDNDTTSTGPTSKTLRWWTIFVCFSLLFLSLVYQNIPDWLGIARFSEFEPTITARIMCQFEPTTEFLDGVDEVRESYPTFEIDYITSKRSPAMTICHSSDEMLSNRLYRGALSFDTVSYDFYTDKDTLLGIIAAHEDDTDDEDSQLPDWLDKLRPYTNRELLEMIIVNNTGNVTFLKECLEHDVVAGLSFTYRWSAKYYGRIYRYYDWAIEKMHLSFAQAVYLAEAIIFVLILLGAMVPTCGITLIINGIINLANGDKNDNEGDYVINKSDFDYFGRHDYREPNRDYDEDDDDEEDYDDEEEDEEDSDDYEDDEDDAHGHRYYSSSSSGSTTVVIRH